MDSVSGADLSLKRVAVVEDFFDIIYAMHVEIGADPGKAPKHAGQKKTYKAVSPPRSSRQLTSCPLLLPVPPTVPPLSVSASVTLVPPGTLPVGTDPLTRHHLYFENTLWSFVASC